MMFALLLTMAVVSHPGYSKDINAATEALIARPHDPSILVRRADLWRLSGRYAEALEDLAHAEGVNANWIDVWRVRGLTRHDMGQLHQAEHDLSHYLQLAGENAQALELRAIIRQRLGYPDEAVSDYDRALALTADVDLFLARARILRQQGRLEAAAVGLRDGLTRTHSSVLRWELCEIELESNNPDAALSLIEDRADIGVRWLLLRARIHDQRGDEHSALTDRERALEKSNYLLHQRPSIQNLKQHARALLALRRYTMAAKVLERVLRTHPNDLEGLSLKKFATKNRVRTSPGDQKEVQ